MNLQIDNTFILINNEFAIRKNEIIQNFKIMTKSQKQLFIANSIRFNNIKIKLLKNKNITLNQKSPADEIQIIKNQNSLFINFRDLMKKKLIFKDQYFVQRAKDAYVASIYQSEIFFDFVHAAQSIDFLSDDITLLNKRLQ